jgi:hypothetical protein
LQAEPSPKPKHAKLYPITVDGKHGFIDETGDVKFMLPEEVYTTFAFSEGLAVAGKRVPNTNGRWGFIDETGKYAIEAKFVMVKPFSEGLAAVVFKENENAYSTVEYIDQSGRIVVPPQFSGEGGVSERGFSGGLAAVKVYNDRVDKWGYIDKSGKSVIEPQFAAAGQFPEGRAMVGFAEPSWSIDYKWGFIDTEGDRKTAIRKCQRSFRRSCPGTDERQSWIHRLARSDRNQTTVRPGWHRWLRAKWKSRSESLFGRPRRRSTQKGGEKSGVSSIGMAIG